MEAQTRGDIEIQIDMMHSMDSPEYRHRVKHYVLKVNCQIEDDNRSHQCGPGRNLYVIQQSPTASFAHHCKGHGRGGKEEAYKCGVQRTYAEIARPAF